MPDERHEEDYISMLRRMIEEQYQDHPTNCGGSFGELLCYEIHVAGLTFSWLAEKWGISLPTLELLKTTLERDRASIVASMERDPERWIGPYHHGWGTAMRNHLRQMGFGELYFGVHNLDDIYVALIEEALTGAASPGRGGSSDSQASPPTSA